MVIRGNVANVSEFRARAASGVDPISLKRIAVYTKYRHLANPKKVIEWRSTLFERPSPVPQLCQTAVIILNMMSLRDAPVN